MNYRQLRRVMEDHDDTNETLAKAMGIHEQTFFAKAREYRGQQFTQREIKFIIARYRLKANETMKIFFSDVS